MIGNQNKNRIKKDRLPRWLPGDLQLHQQIQQVIRVNHAGEYGAKRIYEGQINALQHNKAVSILKHMQEQEEAHLQYFTEQIKKRQVRPTIFQPLWHWCGYFLGWGTARIGVDAAMACTVAVESEIEQHYDEQLNILVNHAHEDGLRQAIAQFRAEEIEHHDIGIEHGARCTTVYPLLYILIRKASKAAIWLSKRW